jgi:pimeloyl-ACP methyl ester carboxylesterase
MECQLPNLTVYYEEYGHGTPILMLHGFTPDHHLMTGCMEPSLRDREGWKRIYLDLPGMGKTLGPDWITSTDQMLDVVLQFIDQVLPNSHFVIAGESYGGYLARGILHERAEWIDGVLLLCPAIEINGRERDLPESVTLVHDPDLLNSLTRHEAEQFAPMAVVQNEYNWQRFRDEVLVGLEVADREFLARISQQYQFSFDVDDRVFEAPSLILLGRQDSSVGYRDAWTILENFPRASFAILDRSGHNLQIEQEAVFSVLLSEWLDRVEEYIAMSAE